MMRLEEKAVYVPAEDEHGVTSIARGYVLRALRQQAKAEGFHDSKEKGDLMGFKSYLTMQGISEEQAFINAVNGVSTEDYLAERCVIEKRKARRALRNTGVLGVALTAAVLVLSYLGHSFPNRNQEISAAIGDVTAAHSLINHYERADAEPARQDKCGTMCNYGKLLARQRMDEAVDRLWVTGGLF